VYGALYENEQVELHPDGALPCARRNRVVKCYYYWDKVCMCMHICIYIPTNTTSTYMFNCLMFVQKLLERDPPKIIQRTSGTDTTSTRRGRQG
jgi:hypothetical protein